VCQAEGIPYEEGALELLATAKESHIRDCYKALEMLPHVTMDAVKEYTGISHYALYLEIAEAALTGSPDLFNKVEQAKGAVPATVVYDKLIDLCLLAYRKSLGTLEIPVYLSKTLIDQLAIHGAALLTLIQRLSARPGKPTYSTLYVDLLTYRNTKASEPALAAKPATVEVRMDFKKPEVSPGITNVVLEEKIVLANGKLEIDPRAVNQSKVVAGPPKNLAGESTITTEEFSKILNLTLREANNGLS
jgi:DNA polymerase III gamma/tau subunit